MENGVYDLVREEGARWFLGGREKRVDNLKEKLGKVTVFIIFQVTFKSYRFQLLFLLGPLGLGTPPRKKKDKNKECKEYKYTCANHFKKQHKYFMHSDFRL